MQVCSSRRTRVVIPVAAVLCIWSAGTAVVASAGPSPSGAFVTAPLPPAPASGLSVNQDAEPGMGVDGAGTFWAASDIEPYAASDPRSQQAVSGADVWKSTDGGQTYSFVAAPFNTVAAQPGAGGEDTDIAVAPVKNATGFYNIYVASLYVASTNIAISQDGGATFTVVPVNGEPGQDRPWLAAFGSCTFYLSYHGLAPYDTIVDKFSLCNPASQGIGTAENPTQTQEFAGNIAPGLTNRFGKQVVDNSTTSPHAGRVYVPMMGCPTPTVQGLPEEGVGCATTAEIVVASSDDGITYVDHVVADTGSTQLYIWPDTVATDSAGNVYVAWFSNGIAYLSTSSDGGTTWSAKEQLNQAPVLSVAYPTVTAAQAGVIEVAFYGTNRAGDSDNVAVMGQPMVTGTPNTTNPTQWQLYLVKSTDGGTNWVQSQVTDTLHTGVVCTSGGGCGTYTGDRNLLDDFGLAISPVTGLSSMVFDNDQPGGVQGLTHTDFASEKAAPANVPETPVPALAVAAGLGMLVMLEATRRRRGLTPVG